MHKYRRVLLFVTALFVFGAAPLSFAMNCGSHDAFTHATSPAADEHGHHQMEAAPATQDAPVAVNVGNKACPVTGLEIDEAAKATVEYKGKIYNLCCAACIDEFKKDPQMYVAKVEDELKGN